MEIDHNLFDFDAASAESNPITAFGDVAANLSTVNFAIHGTL